MLYKGIGGGLTLAGRQEPIKASLLLLLLRWTEERNITKGSWVEIRTGIDHSPISHRQNRLNLAKLI